jgi:DNA-binding transcriptional LysR family regulator
MEFNQIRYFVALARTLHFTKAAEACNVSQPALTKAIQKLEEELGGPLFLRERSNTQLTDLGRLMLPPLERALASARDAKMQADAFRRRDSSPLHIGLEHSIPTSVLGPILAVLRRHMPNFELSLKDGAQADLCERMLSGEIDVALFVQAPELNERLHRWRLFAERYVLICPPDHRFRELDDVDVEALAEECLLLHEDPRCPIRRYLAEIWAETGARPRQQHFGSSQSQVLDMVQASLGVTVAGERLPIIGMLLRRALRIDPDRRNILLVAVAGRPMGPTPSLFVKLMRAHGWTPGCLQAEAMSEAA